MKLNKVGIVSYSEDPLLTKAIDTIVAWSKRHKRTSVFIQKHTKYQGGHVKSVDDTTLRESDVIISIGGDGTFLSAARIVAGKETPIIGINLGTVGFLTDYPITLLEQVLEDVSTNKFHLRDRLMLNVTVLDRDKILFSDYALNEIMIRPMENHLMADVAVSLDGKPLTVYKSDSLIISTPTGSTAYNLAAGGPIVYPRTEAIIINPINPSSLTVRPMIIPSDMVMTFNELNNQPTQLVMDGRVNFDIIPGSKIVIKRSKWCTKIIKSNQYGFMDALKDKLGWSGQPHIKQK